MNNKLDKKSVPEVKSSESDISTRLTAMAAKFGGKQAFADKIGLSYSQLHRVISGEADLKLATAVRAAQVCDVSLEWLAQGKGEARTTGEDHETDDEFDFIPGYSVQVSAGNGSFPQEHEQPTRRLAFRKRWLSFRGLQAKDLVMVFAKGDSMEPTISDNNTLMVDTSDTRPQDGRIYVIRHGDQLVVKRTQLVLGSGVRLISDNKAYPEQVVDLDASDELSVVGRVVWIGKDV